MTRNLIVTIFGQPYTPESYFDEIGELITQMGNDPLVLNRSMLLAPSVSTGPWKPEDVWNTGFISAYESSLAYLAVEQYVRIPRWMSFF